MNLKLGIDGARRLLSPPTAMNQWSPRSKVKVAISRDASDRWVHKSRMNTPRNTKIGRKVANPTGNNAHQFQGQKVKGQGQQVD